MRVPELSKAGPLDLVRGFALPFRALALLFATPRLVALTLTMAGVTLCTLVGLAVTLWSAAPGLATAVVGSSPSLWAAALRTALAGAFFLGLFLLGANTLPLTLAAPLMDPISIQTERTAGFPVAEDGGIRRALRELARSVANGLLRLAVLAAGQGILLLLLAIPVIGGPLWTALSFGWASLWLTAAYLDIPMARHLYTLDHEVSVLKRRFWLCLGFGAAVALMLWVPLLNFFFVPVAVIAATLLFRGLVAAGVLPPPVGGPASAAPPSPPLVSSLPSPPAG